MRAWAGMFRVTVEVFSGDPTPPTPAAHEHQPQPGYPPYEQPQPHPAARRPAWAPQRAAGDRGRPHLPASIGPTVIGRGSGHARPSDGISRRHTRIDFDGTQVVLTDLGPTNGSMVNGQRISAVTLNPADMIQIGIRPRPSVDGRHPGWLV